MASTESVEPPVTEQNNNSSKDSGVVKSSDESNANTNANASTHPTPLSGMPSGKRSIPSPITSAKANTAADNRAMRRIIAEDPEWSLATVPLLTELCVSHIVHNFAEYPKLNELLPKYKAKVLEKISVDLPLKVVAHLVTDEGYWQRRCKAGWKVCDVSKYGNSWKRMFFERHLEHIIEHFVPESTDTTELMETLPLASPYVRQLNIKQLLPPVKEELIKVKDDASDAGSEAGSDWDGPQMDHFEFSPVIERLPSLEKFHVTYGVRDCGMNFEWNLFQFTQRDCLMLAKCMHSCKTLSSFQLHRSKVDDDKVRVLISHMLDHPTLTELDLSHNIISDSGARGIGKFLNGHSQLVKVNLSNNKIKAAGAAAIGHALKKNTTLKELNLGLNRLGDEGGQALCKALLENVTLEHLILAGNELSEPTAAAMAQVAIHNSTIRKINLSCNTLGQDGGKQLQEGMEENSTIIELDLRLTEVGQESEYCINQILKKNKEQHRELLLQKQDKLLLDR
ncbi:Dynein regulatory complex subunit 5 [Holothuria leucospilota]|uniref:Dynein regulatory complex subunit 5 n=1 Tax=Holothuria leucospilota TaxID=206669 RepID=A0A9Q1CHY6_HOLLE|nr:Dynein regulatory complex subunit 5 [Holothuria leucospilota]